MARAAGSGASRGPGQVREMSRNRRLAVVALGSFAVQAATLCLSAQDTVPVLGDELSCGHCRISLDTVATIGGGSGPGLDVIMRRTTVAVDRRGRILAAVHLFPEVSVFDSAGRFLRKFGRSGEGPGEFQFISHMDAGSRHIHVFDVRGRTLLDYDFQPLRRDPFPGQVSFSVVTASDDIVFVADVPTPRSAGHTLHRLSPGGDMQSYGGGSVYTGPTSSHLAAVTGDDPSLWVVEHTVNRMSLWDSGGEPAVQRVFERAVEEFDRHDPELWPSARNVGAMLDDRGLWIVWQTAEDSWRPKRPSDVDHGNLPPFERIVDSWVDLVDPSTGRTIARHHNDGFFKGFAHGSPYVVAYQESEAGIPFIHLLRIGLTRSGAPEG